MLYKIIFQPLKNILHFNLALFHSAFNHISFISIKVSDLGGILVKTILLNYICFIILNLLLC
ncbi:hypothetical protein OA57_11680 [Chelonobacter oris]|uniref:Uncharacterized protein n=1 Tax=Chelonobacter oris TaxID=505317 RepID=A0A0A3AQP5_9PAST|nr:hypothetical protein OA57_11680 [Chelonobacter oris]